MDSQSLLKAIFNTAIDGIVTIDRSGYIESFNPAATLLFGYQEHEVIGRNVSLLMPEPDKTHHDSYIQRYVHTSEKTIIGTGREVLARRKNGSLFPIRLAVSEVKWGDELIFAGFIHDLSEQKDAEEKMRIYASELENTVQERTKVLRETIDELKQAKDALSDSLLTEKALSEMKSRFVSMASHEFRTPLSSIRLSSQLIERYSSASSEPLVFKHLVKIQRGVDNLTNILEDFLSLERLEGGKVRATYKLFNLVELAGELVEELQLMTKTNQTIIYHHEGSEQVVFSDPHLIRNCLINLISNAVKYSGQDTFIEIKTEISDAHCCITVKDNGIGIPEADQKSLFQPFFRAHNAGSVPGTGLGLNIVKRYTELIGGSVRFESQVDQGTQFVLTFNLSKQEGLYESKNESLDS